MKALAREPDERYQDAAEMHRALERVLRERPPPTASELARFMELLFDRDEREEAVPRTTPRERRQDRLRASTGEARLGRGRRQEPPCPTRCRSTRS